MKINKKTKAGGRMEPKLGKNRFQLRLIKKKRRFSTIKYTMHVT